MTLRAISRACWSRFPWGAQQDESRASLSAPDGSAPADVVAAHVLLARPVPPRRSHRGGCLPRHGGLAAIQATAKALATHSAACSNRGAGYLAVERGGR